MHINRLYQYAYVNYNFGIDIFLHWSKLANDMLFPANNNDIRLHKCNRDNDTIHEFIKMSLTYNHIMRI